MELELGVTGGQVDLAAGAKSANRSYTLQVWTDLKAAPEETLVINLISGNSPCVLTPEDGSEKFLYMILPVRLRAE